MTCAGVPVGLDPHAIDIDPAGSIYLMGVPVPDAVLRASDETTSSPETPRPDVTCSGGGDDAATPSFG